MYFQGRIGVRLGLVDLSGLGLSIERKGVEVSNLLRLIGRRLIALPIMIIGVTILVFFLMALSPIDQAYSVLGDYAS